MKYLTIFMKKNYSLSMKIKAKLFAPLTKMFHYDSNSNEILLDMADDSTVLDLLHRLNIPDESLLIIMVNGIHRNKKTNLNEGDFVSILPTIAGG